jgi:hypothetical protein
VGAHTEDCQTSSARTAAAALAHFLIGGVCYHSGQDTAAVLRETRRVGLRGCPIEG